MNWSIPANATGGTSVVIPSNAIEAYSCPTLVSTPLPARRLISGLMSTRFANHEYLKTDVSFSRIGIAPSIYSSTPS